MTSQVVITMLFPDRSGPGYYLPGFCYLFVHSLDC